MKNTKEKRNKFVRFYNVYYICKSCINAIENVRIREVRNSNNNSLNGYRILEWNECRKILPELEKISSLKKYVNNVCNSLSFIAFEQVIPEITIESYKKFKEAFEKLAISVKTIINLYESMELGKTDSGIDVKIPSCDSLKEYMDYLKEIDFIFTQCPYLQCDKEQIKFKNVDVGSQWLNFMVISTSSFYILNNLAKLIERAIAMKSYLKTIRQQDEILKSMQVKNEVASETLDVFKTMKRITMEGYVKELESELGELKDGEERGKVEKSLEKLAELIDKGVEIYSSIETPNEVKALFPMSENNVLLPDNIIKLLEEKSGENKEE